jgi:hypothetical protein
MSVTVFEFGGPNYFNGAKSRSMTQADQQQSGKRLFTVTYGLQRKTGLTYAQACAEIGACILHHQCCNGVASNEGA